MIYILSNDELGYLSSPCRTPYDKRDTDPVEAVILLNSGWSPGPRCFTSSIMSIKEPRLHPGKADDDIVLFMNGGHPQHKPVMARGWKRGETFEIPSNTSQRRLNISELIRC